MDFLTLLMAKSLAQKEVATELQSGELLNKKADLVNGTIPLSQIPPAAIERIITVENDTARFALTSNDVQLGDTIKVVDTNKMYFVIDVDSLNSELGYQVYVAGKAAEAIADQNGNVIDTTYATVASIKTIWQGTAAEYSQLQTDNYDLYFIEEVSSS